MNPADAAQSASDYETDENSVMFLVPRSHQVDSELSQFVSKHHTSVATLHNLYPERIISSKESFYIRAAGLRSLDGLASVSNRYHFPHSQKRAHAGVRYVCFDKNYLQNLYVQEIKNVFPYVTTIHCDENPLHSIDLKGARLGNTFSLKSIAHDVTIDLDSLSDLPPINLHLNKNSLSAEHAAAL